MSTNFPGSLDSYTTHVNLDVIQPSHVNNLQDAVVAVQTQLWRGGSGYPLANGVAVYDPRIATTSTAVTAGRLNLAGFTSPRGLTVSNMTGYAVAIGSSVTLFKFGIYTLDSSGNGTLVASTANQATAINTTNGVVTYALSSSYALVPGVAYAAALLSVGGTPPQFACNAAMVNQALATATNPFSYARLNSQTDLPSTFTFASLSTGTQAFWQAMTG